MRTLFLILILITEIAAFSHASLQGGSVNTSKIGTILVDNYLNEFQIGTAIIVGNKIQLNKNGRAIISINADPSDITYYKSTPRFRIYDTFNKKTLGIVPVTDDNPIHITEKYLLRSNSTIELRLFNPGKFRILITDISLTVTALFLTQ